MCSSDLKSTFLRGRAEEIKLADNPGYVLPSGYGLFRLDDMTKSYLLAKMETITDPKVRGAAWLDLWENFLDGQVKDGQVARADLLRAVLRALPVERDQQIASLLLGYMDRLYWYYSTVAERAALTSTLETLTRETISNKTTAGEIGRAHV